MGSIAYVLHFGPVDDDKVHIIQSQNKISKTRVIKVVRTNLLKIICHQKYIVIVKSRLGGENASLLLKIIIFSL